MWVCRCESSAHGKQRRAVNHLVWELEGCELPTWVPGTKLRSLREQYVLLTNEFYRPPQCKDFRVWPLVILSLRL